MRLVITLIVMSASMLPADELTVFWELPESGVQIQKSIIGEYFHIEGVPNSGTPGAPSLPLAPLYVVLPRGAVAFEAYISDACIERLPGSIEVKPAQAGVPLSLPQDFELTPANPCAYGNLDLRQVEITGQGGLMGYNILNLSFRPVSWDPADGTAEVFNSMTLTIRYRMDNTVFHTAVRSETGERIAADMVRSLVLNPQDIMGTGAVIVPAGDLEYGDYLIIVSDDLEAYFEPLAEWKTVKGIPASIVTTGYIALNYSGVDLAQKIRFFLRSIYDSGPPTFVLLAGDTPLVAHRNCWASAEGYTGDPAADIYYQDMNDTAPGVDLWDANLDGVWGEIGVDLMDYHPDYLIGRASVETSSEAEIFVAKVIAYEDGCDSDAWFDSMGFTTGILWSSPYCPGSAGKEKVDTLYTPSTWTIEKHYQSAGTQSYALTMSMLNRGQHLVNHAGHGSNGSVSIGTGSLTTSDFMGLTNITSCDRPSIWNTIACNSGGFDQGYCLAEAWIRSPGGGGFCMMNTRYGWGEPSEPGGQWSELVDQEFFAKFFIDDLYLLGEAHAMAKDEFIALIPSDTHYDWIAKSLTLFGDPELPMWNQVPDGDLEFSGPAAWYQNMTTADVSVSDDTGPLEGARVCILRGDWNNRVYYGVEYTNAAGTATFSDLDLTGSPAVLTLTCWARNHSPVSQEFDIESTGIGGGTTGIGTTYLHMPWPNPSSGCFSLVWGVAPGAEGTLTVHDLSGRLVAILGEEMEGSGTAVWGRENNDGHNVPAGIYFARLIRDGNEPITRRMVVLR